LNDLPYTPIKLVVLYYGYTLLSLLLFSNALRACGAVCVVD
jgi:hypothetical protein